MFIHIGTLDIPLTVKRGEFFCPTCREQLEYVHKRKKRFLTIYFIPLIPLQDLDEFVKCTKCRQQFGVEIPDLMVDAAAAAEIEAATANDHVLRMMVLAMIADGFVDDRELEAIRECQMRLSGRDMSNDDLRDVAGWADIAFDGLCQYARQHADELSLTDKQSAVRCVFLVASASGAMSDEQQAELAELPAALDMDEEMFRNIIEEAALGRA